MKCLEFRGRQDKLHLFGQIFGEFLQGDVLDLGCDTKALQAFVKGKYVGIDISGKPDIQVNLEYGIPFDDKSFDCVVAIDVLEHLDNIHFVFDEMCRVSRQYIIVGLPNMYEWRFRLGFVFGHLPGGKYSLPVEKPVDRHKWLFSLADATQFVRKRGERNGFLIVREEFCYYHYKRLIAKALTHLGRQLGEIGRNLFVYSYWAALIRREKEK